MCFLFFVENWTFESYTVVTLETLPQGWLFLFLKATVVCLVTFQTFFFKLDLLWYVVTVP